ncbi:MAG: hypothetical protein H0V18_18535 [Pyrinomonadaceae bacterium]|nr:hypothetical protein [Pyrinomonadaceae bacterium]
MTDSESILNATVLYSEERSWRSFKKPVPAEATEPGQHTERLRLAASDLCELLERKNGLVKDAKRNERDAGL